VEALIPLLVALPLLAAGVSVALWRMVRLQQLLALVTVAAVLVLSIVVLARVEADGAIAVDLGGWPAPVGITLVADLMSALFLCVSLATILAVLVYAIGQPRADKSAFYFHPLYLILTAGVSASFLTVISSTCSWPSRSCSRPATC
jgi:multicomponent Na+:H+ antiporter subunit D